MLKYLLGAVTLGLALFGLTQVLIETPADYAKRAGKEKSSSSENVNESDSESLSDKLTSWFIDTLTMSTKSESAKGLRLSENDGESDNLSPFPDDGSDNFPYDKIHAENDGRFSAHKDGPLTKLPGDFLADFLIPLFIESGKFAVSLSELPGGSNWLNKREAALLRTGQLRDLECIQLGSDGVLADNVDCEHWYFFARYAAFEVLEQVITQPGATNPGALKQVLNLMTRNYGRPLLGGQCTNYKLAADLELRELSATGSPQYGKLDDNFLRGPIYTLARELARHGIGENMDWIEWNKVKTLPHWVPHPALPQTAEQIKEQGQTRAEDVKRRSGGDVILKDVRFRTGKAALIADRPTVVATQVLLKNSAGAQSMSFTAKKTNGKTSSFSKTVGFKVGVSVGYKFGWSAKGTVFGSSGEISTTFSFENSMSRSWSESNTETEESSYTFNLHARADAPIGTEFRAEALVFQREMDVPYTATLVLTDMHGRPENEIKITSMWRGVSMSEIRLVTSERPPMRLGLTPDALKIKTVDQRLEESKHVPKLTFAADEDQLVPQLTLNGNLLKEGKTDEFMPLYV